ncbi:hypothetical protein [Bremerella cremea]|uniref:hypothetical protein n=1 Tax=Bremerella cremea TaxID=1031537 RepID=UPI0031E7BFBD
MRTHLSLFALSFCTIALVGCTRIETPDLESVPGNRIASDARTSRVVSLQLGEQPGAFQVEDVTGPAAGEHLCYRCKYAGKPTVVIFTREVNDSVTSLVQQIDQKVGENADKKLAAFMVVIGDQSEAVKEDLHRVQTSQHIKNTPLTIFDGAEGPAGYGLAPSTQVQVMMWNNDGLKVNEAVSPQLSPEKISELVAQTKTILN